MQKQPLVMIVMMMVGCADEPSTGLEVTSDESGLSGWYRGDDAVVGFETVRDPDGELAARFFDESGWSVVEGSNGTADVFAAHVPSEQQVARGGAAHRRAAQLVGEAAAALATAEVSSTLERDTLVALGTTTVPERGPEVASYTGTLGAYARCSRSVREWTTFALENDASVTRARRATFHFRRSDGSQFSSYTDVSVPAYSIVSRLKVSRAGEDMTAISIPGLGSGALMYAWIQSNFCSP